jgi:hypothetical protein
MLTMILLVVPPAPGLRQSQVCRATILRKPLCECFASKHRIKTSRDHASSAERSLMILIVALSLAG